MLFVVVVGLRIFDNDNDQRRPGYVILSQFNRCTLTGGSAPAHNWVWSS